VSYGVTMNRQNPFAGAAHDAVFNSARRISSQILYWAPAMVAGYYAMTWAIERFAYTKFSC
jgi:ubiquinol-cytochrome c reductase subunit 8